MRELTNGATTRWIIGLAVACVGGFGTLLVMAFRIGVAVQANTSTMRALAQHECRMEERQKPPLSAYEDCLYDITGVKP